MSHDEAFLERLALAIAKLRLDALVVGMTAASLQGVPLLTQDVDLLVRDTKRNREKLAELASEMGAAKNPVVRELSDVITFLGAAAPIDVLFDVLPGRLRFESLKSRAVRVPVGRGSLRLASLADVAKSKRAVGRPKDKAQLLVIEDVLKLRKA